jgi:Lon protease-like protein
MVEEVLSTSKRIGIALLKEGWERDYFGFPDVHLVGCVGEIQYSEKLDDGKFNIMLYGLSRVKIVSFIQDEPYRIAKVEYLKDSNFDYDGFNINYETENFIQLLQEYLEAIGVDNLDDLVKLQSHSLESIMNQMASVLDMTILEKQRLLEIDSLQARYEQLTKIIRDKLTVLEVARSVKFVPEDPQWN